MFGPVFKDKRCSAKRALRMSVSTESALFVDETKPLSVGFDGSALSATEEMSEVCDR